MELSREMFARERMGADDAAAFVRRYRKDPVLFASEILSVELDENQATIARLFVDRDYIAVASGKGIGKSVLFGVIALWWLSVFGAAKVVMLSNTDSQAERTLWPPLLRMLKTSMISDWFESDSRKIYFSGEPESGGIERISWSVHTIEATSGVHSANLLILCDEAGGMPEELLANLYTGLTERNNKMAMFGNPTRSTGYFHDAFSEGSRWETLHIDSRSSKFTDKLKIHELISEYGEDSDRVRVNVRGLFPLASGDLVIPEGLLNKSLGKTPPPRLSSDPVVVGLDIGGGGDSTTWAVRIGDAIVQIDDAKTTEEDQIIERTSSIVERFGAHQVVVDMTGIGYFIPAKLRQRLPSISVVGRSFGEASPEPDCFNMRAWLYRQLRDWVRDGGSLPNHRGLREDLMGTEWFSDDRGRWKLRSKDEIKDNIGRSPDFADAVALSCGGEKDTGAIPRRPSRTYGGLSKMILDAARM